MDDLNRYFERCRELLDQHLTGPNYHAWCARHWSEMEATVTTHGDSAKWESALRELPVLDAYAEHRQAVVTLHSRGELPAAQRSSVEATLRALIPWRKGPFEIFDIEIDAEWRSDQKWQRVSPHLSDLGGRKVLDVGCGNGYYLWRMLGKGAELVVGIDPSVLCLAQFRALEHYQQDAAAVVLPLGSASLDVPLRCFDTVFSMGVLYHRRQPEEHLGELNRALKRGGELVLETIILDANDVRTLEPPGRYAQMRNVSAIPSPAQVLDWLSHSGFEHGRCVDITPTALSEQRQTSWMPFNSLVDFLHPNDPTLTIEGHPAPVRGVFIARAT